MLHVLWNMNMNPGYDTEHKFVCFFHFIHLLKDLALLTAAFSTPYNTLQIILILKIKILR